MLDHKESFLLRSSKTLKPPAPSLGSAAALLLEKVQDAAQKSTELLSHLVAAVPKVNPACCRLCRWRPGPRRYCAEPDPQDRC